MTQPSPDMGDIPMPEPSAIKVFGIMHLVVAAYGLFTGVAGLIATLFMDGFSKVMTAGSSGSGPSGDAQAEAMVTYMSALKPFTLVTLCFGFVLTVMLIIAGVGLLRSRESGRLMSIRYAWTSIITKLITLVYTFTHVIPITKRFSDSMYQGMPSGMGDTMSSIMQYSQVFSILVTFTYPVVVLFVMKGDKIRQYLAGR